MSWFDAALCKGKTHLFFPQHDGDQSYAELAKSICKRCPVREECLDYALQFPPYDMHGVWAGLNQRQLRQEAKKRGVVPCRPSIAEMWRDAQ